MRLRCGHDVFEPVPRRQGDAWDVTIAERTFHLELAPVGDGVFVVREGGHTRDLHLARDGAALYLFWDGVAYALSEEREGARPAQRFGPTALEAPMPGRVSAVKAAPGRRVSKGEELIVVEAMKMENAVRAPRDGVVRAVHVRVGEMVAPGRPLLELEA